MPPTLYEQFGGPADRSVPERPSHPYQVLSGVPGRDGVGGVTWPVADVSATHSIYLVPTTLPGGSQPQYAYFDDAGSEAGSFRFGVGYLYPNLFGEKTGDIRLNDTEGVFIGTCGGIATARVLMPALGTSITLEANTVAVNGQGFSVTVGGVAWLWPTADAAGAFVSDGTGNLSFGPLASTLVATTLSTTAATAFTLSTADNGKVIETTAGTAVTATLSATAAAGTRVTLTQTGAGQVTFTPASGAALRNYAGYDATAGQWAVVGLYVRANSGGSAAEWVLTGEAASGGVSPPPPPGGSPMGLLLTITQ